MRSSFSSSLGIWPDMLLPNRYRLRVPATIAIAGAIAAVACILRIWAGFGDLWLDEVWSIQLADEITAPWQVVTRLRSDNNHMLNTAYVAWLGTDQPPLLYRLLSSRRAACRERV